MASGSNIKKWSIRIALILGGTFVALFAVDRFLGMGKNDEGDNRLIAINDSINLANKAVSDLNPYGFTDSTHSLNREQQKLRIGVLGDSFVWGDGLPYTQTWPHKLGQKMQKRYGKSVEVLPWGRNGWETVDHLKFYEEEGSQFEIDLLLIGFVENDFDLGLYEEPDWNYRENNKFMYKIFPNMAEKFLGDRYAREYVAFQQKNRSAANLGEWRKVTEKLLNLARKQGVRVSYVLTPNCLYPECLEPHQKVDSLLKEIGAERINLISAMQDAFADVPSEELYASKVNPHPGPRLTELFADEAMGWIVGRYDSLLLSGQASDQ